MSRLRWTVCAEAEDLVFGVGNDYDNATARTLGSNQVMLSQYLDTKTGDTYWSQYTGAVTGAAGSTVTLNDTAPTGDLVEHGRSRGARGRPGGLRGRARAQ